MLRANSNQVVACYDNDDDGGDDDTGALPPRCGEMLAAISQEYEERCSRQASHDGTFDATAAAGEDEIDEAKILDYRDEAEEAAAADLGALDLFSLVKAAPEISRKEWEMPNSTAAAAAAASGSTSCAAAAASTPSASASSPAPIDDDLPMCSFAPEEGTEMFLEEIESIKAVFGEENVFLDNDKKSDDNEKAAATAAAAAVSSSNDSKQQKSHLLSVRVQVLSPTDIAAAIDKRHIKKNTHVRGLFVSFLKTARYPAQPLEVFIEPWDGIFSFGERSVIYNSVIDAASGSPGEPMLFNMVQAASISASTIIESGAVLIDAAKRDLVAEAMKKAGFRVRLGAERINPTIYLGSISSVLGKLPPGYDVMLVENVLRSDLARRFEGLQQTFFQRYVKNQVGRAGGAAGTSGDLLRRDPALAALCDVRVAFHGTRMSSLESIVEKGLRVPGKKDVRVGSRFGRGVYSTPDPGLALCYSESGRTNNYSVKLLVCAVLLGKSRIIGENEEHNFWGAPCEEGYDSHIGDSDTDSPQFVSFHPAQLLPVLCLHLMERKAAARSEYQVGLGAAEADKTTEARRLLDEERGRVGEFEECQRGPKGGAKNTLTERAAARKKRRDLLTDLARKNLPYGFGASGTNFVVEEIASCSDDDEDIDKYVGFGAGHDAVAYEEFQHAAGKAKSWNSSDDGQNDDDGY